MKLLVVSSWWPFPLDNGSRVRAFHLVRHLAGRHDVTLVSFGLPGGGEQLGPLAELCDTVQIVPPVAPGRLSTRGLFSPLPRHFVQTDSDEMRRAVRDRTDGHDVAVALQIEAARYVAELDLPKVFEEVEVAVFHEQFLRERRPLHRLRYGLTWWKYARFVRGLIGRFDEATVVSAQEREHVTAIGCEARRLTVVPNGVALAPWAPAGSRAMRLIYPGPVTYSANLDAVRFFVREILPRVRRDLPQIEFWVTGSTDGVDVCDLQEPGVTFTGRLPEVDSAVAESLACVVPLRIGGGTRLKVLQAMALGTPVVSTTKGIEGIEVEAGRHVLVADSPEVFARHVRDVCTDAVHAARLAAEARGLTERLYGWDRIGSRLEEVIARASDGRRRRVSSGAAAPVRPV
jgi:glycosyltransferase involved in cell wall biosynthesis